MLPQESGPEQQGVISETNSTPWALSSSSFANSSGASVGSLGVVSGVAGVGCSDYGVDIVGIGLGFESVGFFGYWIRGDTCLSVGMLCMLIQTLRRR